MDVNTIFLLGCCVTTVDACFSGSDFYCAQLWYFWFVIFWTCILMFVGAIVITNLCTKKKRRIGNKSRTQYKSQQKTNTSTTSTTPTSTTSTTTNNKNNNHGQGIITVLEHHGTLPSKDAKIPISTKEEQISKSPTTPRMGNGRVVALDTMTEESPDPDKSTPDKNRNLTFANCDTKINVDELGSNSTHGQVEADNDDKEKNSHEPKGDKKEVSITINTSSDSLDEKAMNDF